MYTQTRKLQTASQFFIRNRFEIFFINNVFFSYFSASFMLRSSCSDFRYESNGIFVLGVGFFSSDKFRLFN